MTLALVLLDFQKGIVQSQQFAWENPQAAPAAVRAAQMLLDAARAARVAVVHVGVVRPHRRGNFDAIRTSTAVRLGRAPRDVIALAAGTTDVEFVLAPLPDEEVVWKVGVSAFQSTRLDAVLRNAGATGIYIAGAFTHMVVESTARQGFDLGYRMNVVRDACCAPASAAHDNALATGIPNFARVCSANEALDEFRRCSRADGATEAQDQRGQPLP
jgi:nicotinamidase-related amidase